MNAFNVIHHLCKEVKEAHPLFIALQFIPNAEWALSLAANKGENEIERSNLKGLFFKDN
jgi:hypothetical protein